MRSRGVYDYREDDAGTDSRCVMRRVRECFDGAIRESVWWMSDGDGVMVFSTYTLFIIYVADDYRRHARYYTFTKMLMPLTPAMPRDTTLPTRSFTIRYC